MTPATSADGWRLVWTDFNEVHETVFRNREKALEYLSLVHGQERRLRPVIEILSEPTGFPSFSLAVGGDESVLTFEHSIDPPYFISLGDAAGTGPSPLFFHGGQGVDHLARNLVPFAAAIEAAEEFLTTGERPKCVDWEQL